MKQRRILLKITVALAIVTMLSLFLVGAAGAWVPPPQIQIIPLLDNTQDGYNLGVDPQVGIVGYKTCSADPTHIVVQVKMLGAVPNSGELNIQLVTAGNDPGCGLHPDGSSGHYGDINDIGTISTNKWGVGYSAQIKVDVTSLENVAPSGAMTYAHVDVEDYTPPYVLDMNQYGATPLMWLQP